MGISLKRPKPKLPDVTLRLKLPGEVGEDLSLYAELFEREYGESFTQEQIAAEIVVQSLAKDPGLKRYKAENRANSSSSSSRDAPEFGGST